MPPKFKKPRVDLTDAITPNSFFSYWEVLQFTQYSLYGYLLYKIEYERPDSFKKAIIYKEYETYLKNLLDENNEDVNKIINSKIQSIQDEKNSETFWKLFGDNNLMTFLNYVKSEIFIHLPNIPTTSNILLEYEKSWNDQFSKLYHLQFSEENLKRKFYKFFDDFKNRMRLTAYDDPMMCFVVDFYDPRGYYYEKQNEIFGDQLSALSSIQSEKRFDIDENFREFIKKCLKEPFANISQELDENLKRLYFIASQLVNMIKTLNKDEKIRNACIGSKVYDEGTWCSKTIDKIIEIFVVHSDFTNNISHSVGENADRNTKMDSYKEYDKHVIDKFNGDNKKEGINKKKASSKKPDAKIYWIDDKRHTTLLSAEVSGPPTMELDVMKNESDRRKLIRCMKTVSYNFWKNLEGWHNKSISKENVEKLKKLSRVMIHIYGFKFSLMLYDEEYFPIGKVRLISDMEIPFRNLDEVSRITQFVANLLLTYNYVKESYDILNEVFNDVKDSEMNNILHAPLLNHVKYLPCKLASPKR